MAPVETHGIDQPVSELGQIVGTFLTFGLALIAVTYVVALWRRERITWPFFLLVSGGLTCLMEPLYDHLYGLWFYEQDQWNLYTTHGSAQPVWVPAAYVAFYGGASVFVARTLARRPDMRTVWSMYGAIAVMALLAEITYVSVLDLYSYQDDQPFEVLGYPLFLAFTNAMSAVVSGILAFRLAPMLPRARDQVAMLGLVPGAFAFGLFGTGILYLSVRHGSQDPSMVLVYLAALTVPLAIASTIRLLGICLVRTAPQVAAPAESARPKVTVSA
jgi:hypothetical protein